VRALAGWIVAGPFQAVLIIAFCTALSFLAPPLTSLLSYGGVAALALYSLHAGARSGALVMLGAALATGLLTEVLLRQGVAVTVTSLLLWVPVWLGAVVLRETRSLAMTMLALSALAMLLILLVYGLFGDPARWWLELLTELVDTLAAQSQLGVSSEPLLGFAAQVAPILTGSLAAGVSFAVLTCLLLGRWWQALLVKPGALRDEFYALRLNRVLSLLGLAVVAVAGLGFGVLSSLALQWSLVIMVPFLFVGLAVVHAVLANLGTGRGWLIAVYVLMSLLPQALVLVVVTGMLDPWLDLRRRTAKAKTN